MPRPPPPRRRGLSQASRPDEPRRGHPEAKPAMPPRPSRRARVAQPQPVPAPGAVGHQARRRSQESGQDPPPAPSTACPGLPNVGSRRRASVPETRYAAQPPPPTTPRTQRRPQSGGRHRHRHRHRPRHPDCHLRQRIRLNAIVLAALASLHSVRRPWRPPGVGPPGRRRWPRCWRSTQRSYRRRRWTDQASTFTSTSQAGAI